MSAPSSPGDGDDPRARGAFFTPHPIAAHLAAAALDGAGAIRSVCDPAAGDGRLLAAVAERHPGPLRLFAADLDPRAWYAGPGRGLTASFVEGDSLGAGLAAWPDHPVDGVDLVIGNPPFLNQLEKRTAVDAVGRDRRRRAFGDAAVGYVDTAALFLVAACQMVAEGGRVAMIMPLSFLTARDAAAARRRVLALGALIGVWVAGTPVFPGAGVQVCAVVVERGGARRRSVRRWHGPDWAPAPPAVVDSDALAARATWGPVIADLVDPAPPVDLRDRGTVGDLATATAGFRGQFYGLAPHVREAGGPVAARGDGLAPMITSGAIEPGRVTWGAHTSRIAGTDWLTPAIDPAGLDAGSSLARWVAARRRPKVVVATQTRVVEAASDPTGEWVPSTPVVAVHPHDPDDVWRLLSVLLAPPVTAWARTHFTGAALSPTAIKLSAAQVLTIPLPGDGARWRSAADDLRRTWSADGGGCPAAAVLAAAITMTEAYDADPTVVGWWRDRAGNLG